MQPCLCRGQPHGRWRRRRVEQGLAPSRVRALGQKGEAFAACQVRQRAGSEEASDARVAPGGGLGGAGVGKSRRDKELRDAIGCEDVGTGARRRGCTVAVVEQAGRRPPGPWFCGPCLVAGFLQKPHAGSGVSGTEGMVDGFRNSGLRSAQRAPFLASQVEGLRGTALGRKRRSQLWAMPLHTLGLVPTPRVLCEQQKQRTAKSMGLGVVGGGRDPGPGGHGCLSQTPPLAPVTVKRAGTSTKALGYCLGGPRTKGL